MLSSIFETIKTALHDAVSHRGHPFRQMVMANTALDGSPRMRTVVLRESTTSLHLSIYTDSRSDKVTQLTENPKASLLFYDPKKKMQLIVTGTVTIHTQGIVVEKSWKMVPENAKNAYSTSEAPGSELLDPSILNYTKDHHFFAKITLIPSQIDYLKLTEPHHIRARFHYKKDQWNGSFLVP